LAEQLKLTPKESITIRSESAELLEVEVEYGPGGKPPPAHFHPTQAERFEVLEGAISTRIDGVERHYAAGERFEIPRGVVHQMWNSAAEPARLVWQTLPAGRTREWYEALDRLQRSGKVGRSGMPGPLAMAPYLTHYSDVFRLAGPQPLVRAALAVLGAAGRLRGYRP
jgi:quercetin dioxygenase-like cupin family protein